VNASQLQDELLDVLAQIVSRLRQDGSKSALFWADWLGKCCKEIAADDFHGVERLFRAYGGLGPLNDLIVTPEQARLQARAWEIAQELKRDFQS